MNELIKEYHRLYAKYKRPEYLEIAATLGMVKLDTYKDEWLERILQNGIR